MHAATIAAISSSVSGVSTTNGYSTRQSVASVTCDTRDRPSKLDVVLRGHAPEASRGQLAEVPRRLEAVLERREPRGAPRREGGGPSRRGRRSASSAHTPLVDLVQPMMQRLDQRGATTRILEQVVLQVRIALDDPDVAEHLVQHPRRAPGAPLAAQLLEIAPRRRAEQPHHDLAVRERRVVVRDLADARRRVGRGDVSKGLGQDGGVHGTAGRDRRVRK